MDKSTDLPPVVNSPNTLRNVVLKTRTVVSILWAKRTMIVLAGMLGLGLGILYAWSKKPAYQATMTFTLDDNQSGGGLSGIAADFGFDLGGLGGGVTPIFSGENILGLLQSKRVIEGVLLSQYPGSKLTFADTYIKTTGLWEKKKLTFPQFTVNHSRFSPLQDSMMQALGNMMAEQIKAVRPDKKIYMFTFDVTTPDEDFSILFGQRAMAVVADMYTDLKTSKSKLNISILERKTDSVRKLLNRNIERRAEVLDANLNPVFQAPQSGAQQRQVDIEANGGVYKELLKQLELARYGLLYQTPLIKIIDEPRRPLKKIKPGKIVYGLGLGILFGLLACAWVYLRYVLKRENIV